MKEIKFYKLALFVNALVPLALLGWDWRRGQLGANPLDFVTRTTGTLTLVFLVLTLAVTPLRKWTGAQWLVRLRRMAGLYAFFYGSLHFAAYVWFDKAFDFSGIAQDVARRWFILVGFLAFTSMVPLAVTSTDRMIKRLGGKRWQKLHRLTYLSAAAGVFHYYLLVKSDIRKPVGFAIVVAALLGYRLAVSYSKRGPKAQPLSLTQPPRGKA
ncbi:MAG TPA: protein-methionine-sulfoxide reductase heme-binding subunit MsrQ [Pyrinomonadaceae bacterium]|jgi:sulfoxide reductase heme-binding subunit YedZ|nr:protein-methionine-sulfoxide reductase heme-binding subunit MsrQ [Pyrinomonadaceae bacterium]